MNNLGLIICMKLRGGPVSAGGGDSANDDDIDEYFCSPSVPATGCFFSFLKLSAALCCSVQVSHHHHHHHHHHIMIHNSKNQRDQALCCSVQFIFISIRNMQVVPAGSEKYRAVQLGVPSVLAQVRNHHKIVKLL